MEDNKKNLDILVILKQLNIPMEKFNLGKTSSTESATIETNTTWMLEETDAHHLHKEVNA